MNNRYDVEWLRNFDWFRNDCCVFVSMYIMTHPCDKHGQFIIGYTQKWPSLLSALH